MTRGYSNKTKLPLQPPSSLGMHWKIKDTSNMKGHIPRNKGISCTEEVKNKVSKSLIGKYRGENSPHWKGGFGDMRHLVMGQTEYKEWRKAVFTRDDYQCVECKRSDTFIHANHIKSWSEYPELRYEVSNGETLCYICHYIKTFSKNNPNAALRWGVPKKLRNYYGSKSDLFPKGLHHIGVSGFI